MKVLKRNQIIIFVIALMLVSAGYLNYTALNKEEVPTSSNVNEVQYAGLGDARLVSSNGIEENITNNEIQSSVLNNEISDTNIQQQNNTTTQTNSNLTESEQYFTSSKINRDTMIPKMQL